MRKLGAFIIGLIAGMAVGIVAVVVHAGMVDLPIIGLVLATLIVMTGSWFLLESGWTTAWLGAALGVAAAAVWLLMYPPANDTYISVDQWPSQLWLLLAPTSAFVPVMWVRRGGEDENGRDGKDRA